MKLSTSAVLLALALTSAIMTVTAAAGSRKMLAANAADATTKVEKKDSTKQWGWGGFGFGGWGGDSGHPAYPHYDYHAPEYVQHGDHYHYVPGHLDYDAFGKRKLLSTVTVEPVEAAEPARSIESTLSTAAAKPSKPAKKAKSVKKTESAQKTDAADHNGHGWGHRHNQGHPSRPHYDYHAASFVPHGDHYHYVPSHYDFHAHGRKMLSPDTNESAEETAAVKATNSQESAQKTAAADQWGTDHGYQFTDNPYQYSQNPFGHHTPGTIPAFGGFPGNSAFGHSHNWGRKMLTAESADAIESTDSTQKTDKTDKADKTNNNEQYGTDHEYQFTDDPYQYTSRYVDHPAEYVQHGDHAHYVPEHQDWYDANAAQHTPGTIPLSSFGRKLMAAESAANAESSKKSEKTQAKDQWGNYYAYHQGEYVPHGDHVHYVPDHYDAVQGTQVAPGVIIPGAAGSVLPAWGKRKLLAAESTTAAESTQSADAVKVAEGAASTKKVEKADQYGTNHGYVFTDPAYQNTPHYDYHAPEYVQHGDHYHYVPGHYDQHDPRYNGDHDDDHHDHDHDQYSNNNYGSSVGSMVGGIIGGILGGR